MGDIQGMSVTPIFRYVDEALKQGYKISSFQGGSRSGKTYNITNWYIVQAVLNARVVISVVRATLPALKRSAMRDFKEIMINIGLWREANWKATEMVYYFENGSMVEFFGCEDEQRVRGSKRDILFVNEANEVSLDVFNQLQMRTTLFTILDYNPSFSDDHWLCELNRRPTTYFKITTYKDNPFLEKNIVEWIESYRNTNEAMWQIYGLGQQRQVEGLIFPNYEVVTKWPNWIMATKQWIGIDFGFSNDPTAIVRVGSYHDDLYIDEVAYETKLLTKQIASILNERKYKNIPIICESADPRLLAELKKCGVTNITPVNKGGRAGSIIAGLQSMQQRNIFVTQQSYNVEKEFRNYTWRQTGEGKWINEPIDKFNHAMDAIRYVVLMRLMKHKRSKVRYKK